VKRILILILFTLSTSLWSLGTRGQLPVYFPDDTTKKEVVASFNYNNLVYISTNDLVKVLSARSFVNRIRGKIEVKINKHRIKISAGSSFIIINDHTYQLPTFPLSDGDDIYIPLESSIYQLKQKVLPGLTYDPMRNVIILEMVVYNVKEISVKEKVNGTIIKVKTGKIFDRQDLSAWVAKNGWFYLTVAGGIADTSKLRKSKPHGIIREIDVDQLDRTAQLGFRLRSQVESHEMYVDGNNIILTLRSPLSYTAEKIKKMRDRWYIDTIVIDAGHGGKDAGAIGTYGLYEKFVTLDIARRVGKLLDKYTNVNIIYTRDEDVFIPLWKRTKIANESNGKLFISIHANSNPNRRIRGFETYILRTGKTQDALDVAQRENAVIKLEEETARYDHLTGDNFIVASLMQNAFMKESEDLASMVQTNLRKNIPSPDRGVKQAGFYVMVGASMPNILVEVGFLSNPQEEKQLRKPNYRHSIAQSIYHGIRQFKDKYEHVLAVESE